MAEDRMVTEADDPGVWALVERLDELLDEAICGKDKLTDEVEDLGKEIDDLKEKLEAAREDLQRKIESE